MSTTKTKPKPKPRAGSLQRRVPTLGRRTSAEANIQIVELWLSGEKNEARLILKAFKIGLDEGTRRERGNQNSTAL